MNKDTIGITVDGKPLEEYLVEHDDDEKKKEAIEDFHQERKKKGIFYHDPQIKCKSARGSSRSTTVLSRAQINREYWRHNMKLAITKLDKVLALLLMGEWMTTKDMARKLKNDDPSLIKGKLNVPSRMVAIYKSPLRGFLLRKDIGAGKKPIYQWKLVDEACGLTLDELHTIYSKRKKAELQILKGLHPWLEDYLGKEVDIERFRRTRKVLPPEEVVEKKRIPLGDVTEAEEELPDEPSKLQKHVADIIQQGLQNAFGVNVKVTGEVKVMFGIIR